MVSQPKTPPPFGNKDARPGLLATTILVTTLNYNNCFNTICNPDLASEKSRLRGLVHPIRMRKDKVTGSPSEVLKVASLDIPLRQH